MLRYLLFITSFILICWALESIEEITDFIVSSLLVSLSTVGWFRYGSLSKFQKTLCFYVTIWMLTEFAAYYFGYYYRNNSIPYLFFFPLQLFVFILLYQHLFYPNVNRKVLWFLVAFTLGIFTLISINSWTKELFPSMNAVLLSIIVLPLSLFQFKRMIFEPTRAQLENQPIFWFNFGTFVFFSFDFFFLSFLEQMAEELPQWMYTAHWIMNIFLLSTYFIAIILDSQPKPNQNDPIS